jgi:hypothetical protein
MGWLRYDSTVSWKRRAAISVDNSAAAAAVVLDVDITIPKDWEDFWDVIDNSGVNIRVTGPDGVTAVSYDIDDGAGGAFNAAAVTARTGRIRVDSMTIPTATAGIFLLWLYFDPDGTVAAGDSVVTMTSIGAGYIAHDRPSGRMYEYRPQVPRAENPRDVTHKGPSEQIVVWWQIDRALRKHKRPSGGSLQSEEPYYMAMAVYNTSAADQTAMYALASNRFYWDGPSRTMWIRCVVKAGTTDTRYTVVPTVYTVEPFAPTVALQTFQPRLGLAVRQTIFES